MSQTLSPPEIRLTPQWQRLETDVHQMIVYHPAPAEHRAHSPAPDASSPQFADPPPATKRNRLNRWLEHHPHTARLARHLRRGTYRVLFLLELGLLVVLIVLVVV